MIAKNTKQAKGNYLGEEENDMKATRKPGGNCILFWKGQRLEE